MKKIITVAICAIFTCISIESYAQTNDTIFVPGTNKQIENNLQTSLLGISEIETRPGRTTISLGGFDLEFGRIRDYETKEKKRKNQSTKARLPVWN